MAIYQPVRRRPWVPTNILPPGPPNQWKPNWGNAYTNQLAFLFLPSATGYHDVVRGDVMTLVGTTAYTNTPFGHAWLLGSTAGGVAGYATTAGGDNYYQPPKDNNSKVHMTIACGAYNPATIATPTDAFFARWGDSSGGFAGNGISVELRQLAGVPRMCANVAVAGTNTQAVAGGGAGITMAVSGQAMTYFGTYDNANVVAEYQSTSLAFGSASSAKTTTPTGIDRVTISNPGTTLPANRCIIWAAGWFRTLSSADTQTLAASIGGLPPGFLRRR